MEREPWKDSLNLPDSFESGDGGDRRNVLARVFGRGDNPLLWSLPLYRLAGIAVRIHVFFVLFILLRLAFSAISEEHLGPLYTALFMGGLFVLVILHEYGHCLACRAVGGDADEILMWPLGGLAFCRPPRRWMASLITTVGGPAVNVLLLPPLAIAVWMWSGDIGAVLFNPLNPTAGITALAAGGALQEPLGWVLQALWSLHYMNAILLAFNVLVPMYPMDGGRILHAFFWRSLGESKATYLSATIGLYAAGVLAVLALAIADRAAVTILGIAAFGAIVCWQERKRLQTEGFAEFGLAGDAEAEAREARAVEAEERAVAKRAAKEAEAAAEVDRILAKISESGFESLSAREKATLERARKRSSGR